MVKRWLVVAAAAVALSLGWQPADAKERYTYLHHSTPTNVFWQAVKRGMDDACAQVQADCQMVFLQQDGNFQEQLNNLEAAIAQKPDGIIMTFAGGEIFDEAIERAMPAPRLSAQTWPGPEMPIRTWIGPLFGNCGARPAARS